MRSVSRTSSIERGVPARAARPGLPRALRGAAAVARPALMGIALFACAPPEAAPSAPAPSLPAGTVLLVDDLPLRNEDVAALARDISALYPEYSPSHARRLALVNELLPRLAAHARHRELWELARRACDEAEPELDTRVPRQNEGNWQALGLGLWSAARGLVPGRWSEPIELPGRFVRVRLDERRAAPEARQEVLRIALHEFPYLEPSQAAATLEADLDLARLTIVDPGWNEVVPETWKRRMRGTKP